MVEHFESLYPEKTKEEEVKKIISYLKEGNSCQVVALAGVGRSNLLGLLSYNRSVRNKHLGENQKKYHFVLLNFSEIRKKPLSEALKFLFLGILDSLRERGFSQRYEKVNQIFKESVEFSDEMVLFQGLKKTIDYLSIEKGLTVVLLFDRFEEYVPDLTSDFFADLRILRNRAKYNFSVVFSLNRPLEELIEPALFSDFFEFVAGRIVYLPILDLEGLNFRIKHLEEKIGKKFDKKTLEKVMELTNGHGKLFILSLEAINEIYEDIPKEDMQLLSYLLSKRPIKSALYSIWNSLNPSEQNFFTRSGQEPIFLEHIGLVSNGEITIPLFKEFIDKEIKEKKEFETDKFELDHNGEIKKGETVFSDQLTSFEYRLFRFLFENKEKISSKEEIIKAVWGEETTTLGVTDQALDQLIFRVRKKIEENPNSPKHLITVKGRGFRFIP